MSSAIWNAIPSARPNYPSRRSREPRRHAPRRASRSSARSVRDTPRSVSRVVRLPLLHRLPSRDRETGARKDVDRRRDRPRRQLRERAREEIVATCFRSDLAVSCQAEERPRRAPRRRSGRRGRASPHGRLDRDTAAKRALPFRCRQMDEQPAAAFRPTRPHPSQQWPRAPDPLYRGSSRCSSSSRNGLASWRSACVLKSVSPPCAGRRCPPRTAGIPTSNRRTRRAQQDPRAMGSGDARRKVGVGLPARKHLARERNENVKPRLKNGRKSPRGRVISSTAILPPGRSTRWSSRTPPSRSSRLRTPNPTVAASKSPSPKGGADASPRTHSIVPDLRRARSSIRSEKSSPTTFPPRRSASIARSPVPQQASRTRSPGHTTSRAARRRRQRYEPCGHGAVHHVVDRSDAVEHPANLVGGKAARSRG